MTVANTKVSFTGADVSLERAETSKWGDVNVDETIGWLALEEGEGSFTAEQNTEVKYSFIRTARLVRGMDNAKAKVNWQDMGSNSPILVGSQSSHHGVDGGWLRLLASWKTGATLAIDEDKSCDKERSHTKEIVSLVVFSTAFIK